MGYTINQIIDYYSKSSIDFVNIFFNDVQPNQVDGNRTTAYGVSGIVIPLSGQGSITLNNEKYPLKDGRIIHAGSLMNLEITASEESKLEYAVIHYRTLLRAPLDLSNEHFLFSVKQMGTIKENAIKLLKYHIDPGNYSRLLAKKVFMDLLVEIITQSKKYNDDYHSLIIPNVVSYIQENYMNQISITELAKKFEMERRRFSEFFEQNVGMSPSSYLTEYRLRIAKEYLRVGEYQISEIAELVGYEDNFYFSRVFKKNIGMSPKQYQKYILENQLLLD